MFHLITRVTLGVALTTGLLALAPSGAAQGFSDGAVYTSTNAQGANEVVIFTRAADGTLAFDQTVATGGRGTGGGLGNQGAVTLSDDHRYLYVVNAGSDELSVFLVREDGLALVDRADTRGERPVSVAQHDDLVYVLNAGSDSVAGFRQTPTGGLRPIPGRRRLSGTGTMPAQIDFSSDGNFLFVTERATNVITRFEVRDGGGIGPGASQRSAGVTPFGFHVGQRQQLVVSEAAGGMAGASTVSSYVIDGPADGLLATETEALPSGESAACWVAGTPDGRLVFVSNTGSDTLSSFAVGFDGELSLLAPQAAITGDGPLDVALTADGLYLYTLNGGDGSVSTYTVTPAGDLVPLPTTPDGLPEGSTGLAAR